MTHHTFRRQMLWLCWVRGLLRSRWVRAVRRQLPPPRDDRPDCADDRPAAPTTAPAAPQGAADQDRVLHCQLTGAFAGHCASGCSAGTNSGRRMSMLRAGCSVARSN
jgi:hypothetical protein